jgi:hypothetical protein
MRILKSFKKKSIFFKSSLAQKSNVFFPKQLIIMGATKKISARRSQINTFREKSRALRQTQDEEAIFKLLRKVKSSSLLRNPSPKKMRKLRSSKRRTRAILSSKKMKPLRKKMVRGGGATDEPVVEKSCTIKKEKELCDQIKFNPDIIQSQDSQYRNWAKGFHPDHSNDPVKEEILKKMNGLKEDCKETMRANQLCKTKTGIETPEEAPETHPTIDPGELRTPETKYLKTPEEGQSAEPPKEKKEAETPPFKRIEAETAETPKTPEEGQSAEHNGEAETPNTPKTPKTPAAELGEDSKTKAKAEESSGMPPSDMPPVTQTDWTVTRDTNGDVTILQMKEGCLRHELSPGVTNWRVTRTDGKNPEVGQLDGDCVLIVKKSE